MTGRILHLTDIHFGCENKAAVQGSLAYFGSYTIDDGASTISVTITGSTFPNFEGQTQVVYRRRE